MCPETSETRVVRVRAVTTPWERTTKVTGSRRATATATSKVGGGTATRSTCGRAAMICQDSKTAPAMMAMGRTIFSQRMGSLLALSRCQRCQRCQRCRRAAMRATPRTPLASQVLLKGNVSGRQ